MYGLDNGMVATAMYGRLDSQTHQLQEGDVLGHDITGDELKVGDRYVTIPVDGEKDIVKLENLQEYFEGMWDVETAGPEVFAIKATQE